MVTDLSLQTKTIPQTTGHKGRPVSSDRDSDSYLRNVSILAVWYNLNYYNMPTKIIIIMPRHEIASTSWLTNPFHLSQNLTHRLQWYPWGNRGPRPGGVQKFQKSRFFKSYDTLTTIPPCQKIHLTKVVSPPKRFGRPTRTLEDNRIFPLKKWLLRPPHPPLGQNGSQKPFFEWKNAIIFKGSCATTKPFRGWNNLS